MAFIKRSRPVWTGILNQSPFVQIHSLRPLLSFRKLSSSTIDIESFKNRQIPTVYEDIHPQASLRLHESLRGFLPHSDTSASDSLRLIEGAKRRAIPLGHHLCYFNFAAPDCELLDDGTDLLHAPDYSWKHRLWAGGSLEMPAGLRIPMNGDTYALEERIDDVKVKDGGKRVFVKVERKIYRAGVEHLKRFRASGSQKSEFEREKPNILEYRWLCFTREPPFHSNSGPKIIQPPTNAFLTIKMTPTPSLLFRFSALTLNAHAIHLNPEYARQAYGLPNVVVHGPLTVVLMADILQTAVQKRNSEATASDAITNLFISRIEKLEYKNMAPLFAGEEMTICCKPLEPILDLDGLKTSNLDNWATETWQVWIQKEQSDKPTMVATCTARVQTARRLKPNLRRVYGKDRPKSTA